MNIIGINFKLVITLMGVSHFVPTLSGRFTHIW